MSEGEKKNFIKQTGLDTYMWRGTMWENYEFGDEDEVFDGWDRILEGITFLVFNRKFQIQMLRAGGYWSGRMG